MEAKKTTVDAAEVAQFSRIADEWWDERGKFKSLHRIGPLRVGYIRDRIIDHFRIQKEKSSLNPESRILNPLSLLDIGCGGGLICEPMARLGTSVTGLDASEQNIAVAKLHAEKSNLTIDYRCTTAEDLLSSLRAQRSNPSTFAKASADKDWIAASPTAPRNDGFDVVLALEIVEHVADVPLFVETTCKLLKPGGLIIYSTLNRTMKSFAFAIVGAEYVMRMLPRGTHQWEKFLKPSELAGHLRRSNIEVKEMCGMVMNPLTWKWELSPRDLDVNYFMVGRKTSS